MPKRQPGPVAQARRHLSLAHHTIHMEVVKRATKIIADPSNTCIGFVMAMGGFNFLYSNEANRSFCSPDPRYCNPVYNLIEEFDQVLQITGNPVRLDLVDGKVIKRRDW